MNQAMDIGAASDQAIIDTGTPLIQAMDIAAAIEEAIDTGTPLNQAVRAAIDQAINTGTPMDQIICTGTTIDRITTANQAYSKLSATR